MVPYKKRVTEEEEPEAEMPHSKVVIDIWCLFLVYIILIFILCGTWFKCHSVGELVYCKYTKQYLFDFTALSLWSCHFKGENDYSQSNRNLEYL